MGDVKSVISWLRTLPEKEYSPIEPSRKRKAGVLNAPFVSPPASSPDDLEPTMSSTPKRRRVVDAAADVDATPRAAVRSSERESLSRSASSASAVTGTSSPKKQMMRLRLSDTVEYKALNHQSVPGPAKTLLSNMTEIGRGLDIIPDTSRSEIMEKLEAKGEDMAAWRYCFLPAGHEDGLPGRIPSLAEVDKILSKATECEDFRHEEAGWNSQVHQRLLESVFEAPLGDQCSPFNSLNCSTARPHREFKPDASPAKMIDLCVYVCLENEYQHLRDPMFDFSNLTPTMTVNHTDFEPTQHRPFVLSIETKKPGIDWDQARLQIGVWHASQWAFLQWGVGQKMLRQLEEQGLNAPSTDEEQKDFRLKRDEALARLGFIPGIIVQGHSWHLVLSTFRHGKTTLLADCLFGTTKDRISVYSVVAGIRALTAWARDSYLPWFVDSILG